MADLQDQPTIIPPPEDILVYLREAARMTDYGALCHQAADEIERLRAALSRSEDEARRYAEFYPQSSDGRNTLIMLAERIAEFAANAE